MTDTDILILPSELDRWVWAAASQQEGAGVSDGRGMTTDSHGGGTLSLLPALPVEVIEKILGHVFLRARPLTPSSDPFHLRGTTHILLVSRAIRQLALPFFYHTIALVRSSDFVTFFGSSDGLFAGPDGLVRWRLVREIAIVHDLTPPVRHSKGMVESDRLHDVKFAPVTYPLVSQRLERVCLLDRHGHPAVEKVLAEEDAVAAARRNIWARAWVKDHHASDFVREDELVADVIQRLEDVVAHAAGGLINQPFLLQRCRPVELVLSTEGERFSFPNFLWNAFDILTAQRARVDSTRYLRRSDRIVLHCSPSRPILSERTLRAALATVRVIECNPLEVRLVAFPRQVTDVFREWKEKAPVSAIDKVVWDELFDRDQAWSWEQEDGSLFAMRTQVRILHHGGTSSSDLRG